ncbi:MAG: dCTP deaminase [Endomicrobium sp.]|jgi:dCTP deaminase|nr:dCTP deaminase [Endomicrobium sp.]
MVKNDKWIKKMALDQGLIEPFEPNQVREGNISFGISSYGYDMRVSNEFMIMDRNVNILDPKNAVNTFKSIIVKEFIEMPPNSTVLGKTIEYFRIPRDIVTIAFGKSTYARCGIFINITPFEPLWEGYVTLSIANTTTLPVKVYANEGIAQVLFLQASQTCEVSYADRKGKYQAQKTITQAKI